MFGFLLLYVLYFLLNSDKLGLDSLIIVSFIVLLVMLHIFEWVDELTRFAIDFIDNFDIRSNVGDIDDIGHNDHDSEYNGNAPGIR